MTTHAPCVCTRTAAQVLSVANLATMGQNETPVGLLGAAWAREREEFNAWAQTVKRAMANATPGALTGRGVREIEALGGQIYAQYGDEFMRDAHTTLFRPRQGVGPMGGAGGGVNVRVHVTTSTRTQASCEAFFRGVAASSGSQRGYNAFNHSLCEAVNDPLLRPYAACDALLRCKARSRERWAHKEETLNSHLNEYISQALPGVLGEGNEGANPGLALWYGCQLGYSLDEEDVKGNTTALRTLRYPCRLLKPYLQALSTMEDIENFDTRGFGEPISRNMVMPLLEAVTEKLRQVAGTGAEEGQRHLQRHADFFFAHDTTVLPLVALLGFLNLGDVAEESHAALVCPFASRLVIVLRQSGALEALYNGKVVYRGTVGEWMERYGGRGRKGGSSEVGGGDGDDSEDWC